MPDPNLQHHLAYRLVQATVASWGFLQAEMDELENAEEQARVYLAALEMLMAYILHAAEVLSKQPYPREQFDLTMQDVAEVVWRKVEGMRRQEQEAPATEAETQGVH